MRNLLIFIFLAFSMTSIAQPANDDCQGSIFISTPDNFCSAIDEYTNVAATMTAGLGAPTSCAPPWNGDQRDVWFTFVTPLGGSGSYDIEINGNTMMQPQVAIYRGACPVIVEYDCASSLAGATDVLLSVTGLDPGTQYWIRVNDWAAAGTNEGDFQLCMEEFFPPVNMINGMSSACTGTLYDSGGPMANYGPNELLTYSICPNDVHSCIVFDITTFDIETNSDFLTFHDGPNALSPIVGQITGIGGNQTIEANSGCLTVVFSSDASVSSAGWVATWECTTAPCSPDGSGIMPPDVFDCMGDIFDSGSDTTGYLNNENWNYSICPNVPNGCIILTLDNYDTQAGIDILSFYDGPDVFSPLIDQVSGSGAGATIIAGSGCLTVAFTSNFLLQGSGWSGSWECTVDPCPIPTPIDITVGVPDSVLIENISSPEVIISNVTLTCDALAYGVFNVPGLSEIGIQSGIVLCTGEAAEAEGPNTIGGTSTDLGQPGDPLIDVLAAPDLSEDACILEFDIYAATSQLSFNYVMGSEEYPEWAPPNSIGFNDLFGFFISGPGIVGEKNIALLPGSATAVSINTINAITNTQYYRDNTGGVTVEYDAFTTVLQAQATVIPCDTYHLKLVIADVGDGAFDSGVFIEANSLTSGVATIVPTFDFSPDLEFTIEGCAEGSITIELDSPQSDTTVIHLDPSGSATNGVDYNLLPDSIVFLPGTTSIDVPFSPVLDGITEGDEFAIIYLQQITNCGTFVYDSAVVEIHDAVEIEFGLGASSGDTLTICKGDSIQLEGYGGIDYLWNPNTGISNDTIFNPMVSPDSSTWYVLTAGVASCNDFDSLFIEVIDISIDIPLGDTIGVCATASLVQLQSEPNEEGGIYAWTPGQYIVDSTLQNPPVMPDTSITFFVSYEVEGCFASDSIHVLVDVGVPMNLIADTTICAGEAVILGATPNGATYTWTPTTGLSNPNVANPLAVPTETTTYTVTGSDGNGNCVVTESVTITISPGITVDAGPDQSLCEGESVQLTAITQDAGDFLWVPSATLDDPFIQNPTATPDTTTTYYVYLTDGPCETIDSMTVTVNSGAGLIVQPTQTICIGDAVSIGVNPSPGVTYTWTPATGLDNPNSPNPTASPTVTTTYTVTANTTNGNCTSETMVTVEVLPIPTVSASQNITICEGESTSLSATGTDGTTFTWSPAGSLSCVTCADPVASPNQTTTYYVQYANSNCADIDSVTVSVNGGFQLDIDPANTTIALGDTAALTAIITPLGSNPVGSVSLDWSPNIGILATSGLTTIVSPPETTTYTVTGTSVSGCDASATAVVEVVPPQYGVPNAFSPNGDNLNDIFTLEYSGNILIEEFKIFDRWGEMVFNNEDSMGWDGKYESVELPQDVYIYHFVLRLGDGTLETLTGDVTLLR